MQSFEMNPARSDDAAPSFNRVFALLGAGVVAAVIAVKYFQLVQTELFRGWPLYAASFAIIPLFYLAATAFQPELLRRCLLLIVLLPIAAQGKMFAMTLLTQMTAGFSITAMTFVSYVLPLLGGLIGAALKIAIIALIPVLKVVPFNQSATQILSFSSIFLLGLQLLPAIYLPLTAAVFGMADNITGDGWMTIIYVRSAILALIDGLAFAACAAMMLSVRAAPN